MWGLSSQTLPQQSRCFQWSFVSNTFTPPRFQCWSVFQYGPETKCFHFKDNNIKQATVHQATIDNCYEVDVESSVSNAINETFFVNITDAVDAADKPSTDDVVKEVHDDNTDPI